MMDWSRIEEHMKTMRMLDSCELVGSKHRLPYYGEPPSAQHQKEPRHSITLSEALRKGKITMYALIYGEDNTTCEGDYPYSTPPVLGESLRLTLYPKGWSGQTPSVNHRIHSYALVTKLEIRHGGIYIEARCESDLDDMEKAELSPR